GRVGVGRRVQVAEASAVQTLVVQVRVPLVGERVDDEARGADALGHRVARQAGRQWGSAGDRVEGTTVEHAVSAHGVDRATATGRGVVRGAAVAPVAAGWVGPDRALDVDEAIREIDDAQCRRRAEHEHETGGCDRQHEAPWEAKEALHRMPSPGDVSSPDSGLLHDLRLSSLKPGTAALATKKRLPKGMAPRRQPTDDTKV